MPLGLSSEYFKAIEPLFPALAAAPRIAVHDVQGRRSAFEGLFALLLGSRPEPADVETSEHFIETSDGASISVVRFSKRRQGPPTSAILHCHGGGMIVGSVEMFKKVLLGQASETGVQIFSVNYRLAPEHKHPIPVEDCYAGLKWLNAHAHEFNVDPNRIAVMGESSGGGLAAGVALIARDRMLSPPLRKQILVYPMLDDRNLKPNDALEPFVIWKCEDNITGWTALLGNKAGSSDPDAVSPYAAPARVQSVEGLPPTYLEVGEIDIFRDEDIEYIRRIAAANISTEFHLYPGVPHIFELFAPDIDVTKIALAHRLKAITSF